MSKEQTYDFSEFRKKLRVRRKPTYTPINGRAYTSHGYNISEYLKYDFSIEEIYTILQSGDLEDQRALSAYYYRTNGEYRNNVDFLASLPLYDTMVVPLITEVTSEKSVLKAFDAACEFIEKLDLPNNFCRITKEWIKSGIYYGILRTDGNLVVIQDLPSNYCRTRVKDFYNLNVLEFNVNYFLTIYDEVERQQIISSFPKIVQKTWTLWNANKTNSPWVAIPAIEGGMCFTFSNDPTPLLLASIPQLKKLDDAIGREENRDANELRKMLIQRMPIDKDGELVFQLEEIADLHESVADMLAEEDTVEVLTTFGETTLENLQETSAATQSADRITKYKNNAYDALGRSSLLFNATNSASLAYMIKKDESLMISYLNVYETWIKFYLNDKFARNNIKFDFEILPTTVFNRTDIQTACFRGAQYGYSKLYAGVALGLKERSQLSLMTFENDVLQMSSKMIPLQSSYTTSGNTINQETSGKTTTNITARSSGGRPELPDEQKSDKTQANIESAG